MSNSWPDSLRDADGPANGAAFNGESVFGPSWPNPPPVSKTKAASLCEVSRADAF